MKLIKNFEKKELATIGVCSIIVGTIIIFSSKALANKIVNKFKEIEAKHNKPIIIVAEVTNDQDEVEKDDLTQENATVDDKKIHLFKRKNRK